MEKDYDVFRDHRTMGFQSIVGKKSLFIEFSAKIVNFRGKIFKEFFGKSILKSLEKSQKILR